MGPKYVLCGYLGKLYLQALGDSVGLLKNPVIPIVCRIRVQELQGFNQRTKSFLMQSWQGRPENFDSAHGVSAMKVPGPKSFVLKVPDLPPRSDLSLCRVVGEVRGGGRWGLGPHTQPGAMHLHAFDHARIQ